MASLDAIAQRIDGVTQVVGRGATQATDRAARLMGDLQKTRKEVDTTLKSAQGLFKVGTHAMGEDGLKATLKQLNLFLKRGNQVLRASRDNILDSMGYFRETSENIGTSPSGSGGPIASDTGRGTGLMTRRFLSYFWPAWCCFFGVVSIWAQAQLLHADISNARAAGRQAAPLYNSSQGSRSQGKLQSVRSRLASRPV